MQHYLMEQSTFSDPANQAVLSDILTYHVLSGDVLADDAIALDGRTAGMLNGKEIRLNVINGNLVLNNGGNRQATVVTTDIIASNGVIHVIDAVADPDDAPKNIVVKHRLWKTVALQPS